MSFPGALRREEHVLVLEQLLSIRSACSWGPSRAAETLVMPARQDVSPERHLEVTGCHGAMGIFYRCLPNV